jgi:hypothetical protein
MYREEVSLLTDLLPILWKGETMSVICCGGVESMLV